MNFEIFWKNYEDFRFVSFISIKFQMNFKYQFVLDEQLD